MTCSRQPRQLATASDYSKMHQQLLGQLLLQLLHMGVTNPHWILEECQWEQVVGVEAGEQLPQLRATGVPAGPLGAKAVVLGSDHP